MKVSAADFVEQKRWHGYGGKLKKFRMVTLTFLHSQNHERIEKR